MILLPFLDQPLLLRACAPRYPAAVRASAAVEVPIELLGVTLAVQDSRLPGAGQGLFVSLADGADSATISSGEVLCGYCDESTLVDEATGDKAVPFAFGDAQKLVLLAGELMPLQRAIAGSGASSLHGHAVRRYGPGDAGVSVVPDSLTQRILVPRPGAPPASELGRGSLGQFANDLAFERGLLGRRHAALEYETASAASNSLSLVWELTLLPPRRGGGGAAGGMLVPSRVVLVTSRDISLTAGGSAVELGCHYGLQYWRVLQELGWLA
uniref:Uncharacterized protein n=1 Tax=Emiliania huxleyi TaxID=2903 RepID=A0A7S3T441_EMIHU|mmetsp:Transcript_23524/g.68670  ORF Transcript_23524/g.68670 Transcript_23524/m.68670 type:complete len:269 (-) Transcript_23524:152-958(-)